MIEILASVNVLCLFRAVFIIWALLKLIELFVIEGEELGLSEQGSINIPSMCGRLNPNKMKAF
jgi:hypothetical protein